MNRLSVGYTAEAILFSRKNMFVLTENLYLVCCQREFTLKMCNCRDFGKPMSIIPPVNIGAGEMYYFYTSVLNIEFFYLFLSQIP